MCVCCAKIHCEGRHEEEKIRKAKRCAQLAMSLSVASVALISHAATRSSRPRDTPGLLDRSLLLLLLRRVLFLHERQLARTKELLNALA